MSVEEHLSGFAPAEPPSDLRERVLALAEERRAPVWRAWWPVAAAAAVLIVAVFVNRRAEAELMRRVTPLRASVLRTDQPYAPAARPPLSAQSWAHLRQSLGKEMS